MLSVQVGPLRLANPVMSASGTFGSGTEMERFFDLKVPGAVVLKTVTLHPRIGNPPPRIAELPGGLLNSIGLPNKGVYAFVEEELPRIAGKTACLVVNFAGEREEEFPRVAAVLAGGPGIDALEVNLSCPNVGGSRLPFARDPGVVERIVRSIRGETGLPLFAKLSPNVGDVVSVAEAAVEGGADGVTLVNTLLGLAVDWRARRPRLSTVFGGYSGPGVKPVALRMVHEVWRTLRIPVIGVGGIASAEDVMEFLVAGAAAVQVGTANFSDPATIPTILEDLARIAAQAGIRELGRWTGTLAYDGGTSGKKGPENGNDRP